MNIRAAVACATLVAIAVPTTSVAHHSAAMFDPSKEVKLVGVVKRFAYTNPHVWIDVSVPRSGGGNTVWSVEGGAPATVKRAGISPQTLKAGDKVTITMSPLRDGRNGGSLRTITLADGTLVSAGATRSSNRLAAPKPGTEAPSL
jgi:hypothetical protein